MADKPTKPPGSITQPADMGNERIAEISNVNRTISNMQQKVNQQLAEAQVDVGEFEGIEEVQNSMIKVLNTLNHTVGSLGHGFAKIASETGKASSDAIKQYGKAIGSDIGLNKQNIIATALAQTSPIFGYFAAKFVETDVFRSAKEKMKTNIANALGGLTSKFKEGFGGVLDRARSKGEKEKPIRVPKGAVPKMQTGGYVKKEGLAYLHPAEVVVPIDKILGKIDESIGITQDLARISKRAQLNSLAKMSTYVSSIEHLEKVGIFKGFLRAARQVQTQYQEPSDVRQLRALLAIQDALGAQVGTMQQVWQKMLVEHPTFRQIAFAMRGLGATFSLPFKIGYSFFKSRGGWASHVSRDRNPMKAMAINTGLIYADGMWQLENINRFTQATAEATRDMSSAITGKKYNPLEGIPTGRWSALGLSRLLLNFSTKWISRGLFGKGVSEFLTKDREFFVTTILNKLLKRRRLRKETFGAAAGLGPVFSEEIAEAARKKKSIPVVEETLQALYKEGMERNKKDQKKLLGYTSNMVEVMENEYDVTKEMNRREKRKTIFGLLGGAFGSIKNLLGSAMGILSGGLIPWLVKKALGFVASFGPKLFTIALNGAITIAKSPTLWAGAAAALIGTKIGQWLDKAIGISEGFQSRLDRLDALANKVGAKNLAKTQERWGEAHKGGTTGFEAVQSQKMIADLARTSRERSKDVGWFGRHNINAIEEAQRQFMNENIGDYMLYGPEQISMLRAKWIKEGGYPSKRFDYPALKYGAEREAAFLQYLREKGTPMALEMLPGYDSYNKKYMKAHLIEKGEKVFKKGVDFAKEELAGVLVKTETMKKAMKDASKNIIAGGKEAGEGIATAVAQSTNIISNTIQNTSSVVNTAGQRTRDVFSEYENAVIKGDYMTEGF